jgi:hypothetical protein
MEMNMNRMKKNLIKFDEWVHDGNQPIFIFLVAISFFTVMGIKHWLFN